ncbi:MAG: ATP-dependent zinc metalloprotease FtsH [Candidatus Omnitrophica bacterium]|nr:ATP-dependent zinc metalloprotease FtsH [Candidatus Omnitrophota bacterium]
MEQNNDRNKKVPPLKNRSNFIVWFFIILGMLYLVNMFSATTTEKPVQEISYARFFQMLKDNNVTQKVATCVKVDNILTGTLSDGAKFIVNIPDHDQEMLRSLRENVKEFDIKPPKTLWMNIFYSLGPMVLFILFLWLFVYRGNSAQGGGRFMAFGKSRVTLGSESKVKITFENVAGVDEAKQELQEVIEFLKDPRKFQRLGGKIPKGVLLMGPPGTGKTLLAKAVAGEASVPFLSMSGSDFVEMFVGVGASRVRDLFEQAKKSAKVSGRGAIIFIDEIDAVGRQRFAGIGGGHDEREQTLNALLVEMDGFNTQEGVILIAATNRPDVLDPALLRPGRFDRQIVIDKPDIVGREGILKVHVKNVKLDKAVELKSIARQTPGFSGADLANLVNEAALLAARRNKETVTMPELQESIERVMAGPERKSKVISKQEKIIVAYHETGHALLALVMPGADPLHKVSILPRGMALGYTIRMPLEDRYIVTKGELLGRITGILGGRVSEEIMFNELSTGAQNDLEIATALARKMITRFGMSEKLGHLTFGHREEQIFLGRDIIEERNYSDQTALVIDQEIRRIIDECYIRAKEELIKHKDKLKALAEKLLEKEVMDIGEIKTLLGITTDEHIVKA